MRTALQRRRDRVAAAWGLTDEIVLIASGYPVKIPGRGDQLYPFRSHPEYFYLADRERPGCVLAFGAKEGWTDFVPRPSEEERVWTGGAPDEGVPGDQLREWLEKRGWPDDLLSRGKLACLGGFHHDGGWPADSGWPTNEDCYSLGNSLREKLTGIRRPKDEAELERMRRAARATEAGFAVADVRPGLSERQVQIEMEAEFFRHGAQRTAYDTIVASGPNAAVLHFAPTTRVIEEGDLVLIDAGAEVEGYAADVTRTYCAGTPTPEQRDLYDIVLAAEGNAISGCRAGREYRRIHLDASEDLARGLVDFGLLNGNALSLVERDAHALFFPHGIGHMVGLGVRDASGYLPGRERSDRPGLKYLRCDFPLEPGYVMTIEPGIYFIPALLTDAARREEYRDAVDWQRVDEMLDFGGIRIEDNVLVTEGEPENLTARIEKGTL